MHPSENVWTSDPWVAIAQAGPRAESGDCARVISRGDGRTIVFLGDVAGHDARASELAAELDARVSELAAFTPPGALLTILNEIVESSWPSDVFVCAVCFAFDPRTGEGTIAVAGQFPPVVRNGFSCRLLDVCTGPALGLCPAQRYPERAFTLGGDDVLVAVTDGVTDPLATGSDKLGLAALTRLLGDAPGDPADVCASLMSATQSSGGHDDATVLAVALPVFQRAPSVLSDSREVNLAA